MLPILAKGNRGSERGSEFPKSPQSVRGGAEPTPGATQVEDLDLFQAPTPAPVRISETRPCLPLGICDLEVIEKEVM